MTAAAAASAASSRGGVDQRDGRRLGVGVGLRQPAERLDAGRARGRQHLRRAAERLGQGEAAVAQLQQRDGVVGGVVELLGRERLGAPPVGAVVALGRAQQAAGHRRERRVAARVGGILDRPVALEDPERAARVEDRAPGRQAVVERQPGLLVAGVVRDDLAPVGEQPHERPRGDGVAVDHAAHDLAADPRRDLQQAHRSVGRRPVGRRAERAAVGLDVDGQRARRRELLAQPRAARRGR